MITIPLWILWLTAIALVWVAVFVLCRFFPDEGSGILPPLHPLVYIPGGILATLLILCAWGWLR